MDNPVVPAEAAALQGLGAGSRKGEALRRILLIAASFSAGLFLIEIPTMTGLVDYGRILGVNAQWIPRNRVSDAELIHAGKPHAHFSGSARGGNALLEYRIPASGVTRYQWDVTYDGHGFRNNADLTNAAIAVIGDSFVEGMTVRSEQLVTSVLARLENTTVANLGQSGYGPQQELVVLKRYGLPLHPRTVVWMFYEGNDLTDVEEYDRALHTAEHFGDVFWMRSFTRNALSRIQHLTKPDGEKASGFVRTGPEGEPEEFFFDRMSASSAAPLTSARVADIDATVKILAEADRLCAGQGCRVVVAFVPTAFRVLGPFCQFPPESQCRGWVLNDLPERIRNAVHTASPRIGYLDLTASLAAAVRRGVAPYYRDDAHWTDEGHRAAAGAIDSYLKSGRIE